MVVWPDHNDHNIHKPKSKCAEWVVCAMQVLPEDNSKNHRRVAAESRFFQLHTE